MTHRLCLTVYPQDTDYGGIVSHRGVVAWLEMARIEFVRAVGLELAELWATGFDLPVVELRVRYRKMIPFNYRVVVLTELIYFDAPRLSWRYHILSVDEKTLHVEGRSDHAVFDSKRGRPSRVFPELMALKLGPLVVED